MYTLHWGIKSSEFIIKGHGDREDSRWMLEIKPGTIEMDRRRLFSSQPGGLPPIKVHLHSKNLGTFELHLYLQIVKKVDYKKVAVGLCAKTHTFIGENSCELASKHSLEDIIGDGSYLTYDKSHTCSARVPGDLNIFLDFSFASNNCNLTPSLHKSYQKLSENFEQFFLSKEMSDVQVKCGDQTFDAHQLILSARSPVFKRMFDNEMKEKRNRLVDIQGFDPIVVQEMLKFIYTGKCSVSDKDADPELASELLKAAHRYQLHTLVEMCGDVLPSTLTPENALELLELSDLYEAQGLKKQAMDMVVAHMKTIRGSDKWKECRRKCPHLCMDITEAMADRFAS